MTTGVPRTTRGDAARGAQATTADATTAAADANTSRALVIALPGKTARPRKPGATPNDGSSRLEGQPHAEANETRIHDLVDPVESRVRGVHLAERGARIEDVEGIDGDPQPEALSELEVLREPQVQVPDVGQPLVTHGHREDRVPEEVVGGQVDRPDVAL